MAAAAAARLLRLLLGVRRHTSGVAERCCACGSSSCASLRTLANVSSSESCAAAALAFRAPVAVALALAVADTDADADAETPPSDAEAGVASAGRSVFGEMDGMLGACSIIGGYCALKSTGKLGGPEHNWLDRGSGEGCTADMVAITATRRIAGCGAST